MNPTSSPSAKKLSLLSFVLLLALVSFGAGYTIFADDTDKETQKSSVVLTLKDGSNRDVKFDLESVSSVEDQRQGLSGRSGLDDKSGMIFLYDTAAERCFWMKDMKFAIDIIWLDAGKKITRIERSLSPDTYPTTYCASAKYVVELPAGTAQRYDLSLSDQLQL